jgi:gluconokinase
VQRDNVFKMDCLSQRLRRLVVMGVSGCGKTSLAQAWAAHAGWHFIEGDALHTAAARARMAAGLALDERHRRPWLRRLATALLDAPGPAVAAASLLRRVHRQQVRAALPGLWFVHLQLPQQDALERCAARTGHFFPAGLVASQYAALEPTCDEADVLHLDATQPPAVLLEQLVSAQLRRPTHWAADAAEKPGQPPGRTA